MVGVFINCNFISNSNLIDINKDNKLENMLRYIYQKHIYFNYAPIYLARHIVKSILVGKSDRIFKKTLPKLLPGYETLIDNRYSLTKPEPPLVSYNYNFGHGRCIEMPFW